MKRLILLLLIIFVLNTIACKESDSSSEASSSPEFIVDEDGDIVPNVYIEGHYREPTQDEIDFDYLEDDINIDEIPLGSSYNAPSYYECRLIGAWDFGVDRTFYFNFYYNGGASTWAFRLDKDGVIHYLAQDIWGDKFGSCYVEMSKNDANIRYVYWQYGSYFEVIKDIR